MIKKLSFSLLLLVILSQPLISQVEYTVTIRGEKHNGYPSSLLSSNKFVFLSYTMRNYQNDYSGIVKINENGEIVDSLLFLPQSDTTTYVWDIKMTSQTGIYSGCGIKRYQGDKNLIWLFEFDEQMQFLWEKIIDTLHFGAMRMEHQVVGDNCYILYSSDVQNNRTYLYNFNKTTSSVFRGDSFAGYGGLVDYLCPIPPVNNTFLLRDPKNYNNIFMLDSSFEIEREAPIFIGDAFLSHPPDCGFINDTEFVIAARLFFHNEGSFIIIKMDVVSMDILETKRFGYEAFEEVSVGMLGVHTSLALQKDYFFVFGASLLQLAPTPVVSFDNNLFLYTFNHEFDSLWAIHLDVDAYYWPFSIAATPDGGCVIGATRYDWHTTEENNFCDAFIVKIAKPNITSIPNIENNQKAIAVFPNPGSNRFLIQTELAHFTLQLYDLQGRLLLTQQNRKEVNTEKLQPGCYVYRIVAENGEATNGKWVKK